MKKQASVSEYCYKYTFQLLITIILLPLALIVSCDKNSSLPGSVDDTDPKTPKAVNALDGPAMQGTHSAPNPCAGLHGPESSEPGVNAARLSGSGLPSSDDCMAMIAPPHESLTSENGVVESGHEGPLNADEGGTPPGVVSMEEMASNQPIISYSQTTPDAATLVSPNGAVNNFPTFQWNAVDDATWYRVWVRDSGTMNYNGEPRIKQWVTAEEAGCGSGTGTCSWSGATVLESGAAKWWILTHNDAGDGDWSNEMNFHVYSQTAPPPAAAIIQPIFGQIVESTTPTLEWGAVSAATQYRIFIRDSETTNQNPRVDQFVTAAEVGCETGTGTCSWDVDTELSEGAAEWWVRTWNEVDNGPWSNGAEFGVGYQTPPQAATLMSPNSNVDTKRPLFEWEAVDNSSWYRVFVRDSETMSNNPRIDQWLTAEQAGCAGGTGTCSWEPHTDLADGDAKWWVRTWNVTNSGPWSDEMEFSVAAVTPGAATIAGPYGTSYGPHPLFEWEAEPHSTWYRIWVEDQDSQQGEPVIYEWISAEEAGCDSGTGTCSWRASEYLADGPGIWWLRTWNEHGNGPWSASTKLDVSTNECIQFSNEHLVYFEQEIYNPIDDRTFTLRWVSDSENQVLVKSVASEEDANTIIDRAQALNADGFCPVYDDYADYEYWLSGNLPPDAFISGEDCLAFNTNNMTIESSGSNWRIVDGNYTIVMFSDYDNAEMTIGIWQNYDMGSLCYVDRPGPIMQYFKQ